MASRTSTNGWVRVGTYSDPAAAHIARGMLETNGIPASLTNDTISSVYPMTDTWAAVDLYVPQSMATLAQRLLKLDGDL